MLPIEKELTTSQLAEWLQIDPNVKYGINTDRLYSLTRKLFPDNVCCIEPVVNERIMFLAVFHADINAKCDYGISTEYMQLSTKAITTREALASIGWKVGGWKSLSNLNSELYEKYHHKNLNKQTNDRDTLAEVSATDSTKGSGSTNEGSAIQSKTSRIAIESGQISYGEAYLRVRNRIGIEKGSISF